MAKFYLEKLSNLIAEIDLENEISFQVETKHFFNGAALYVNNIICASWSPVGLAFKLPEPDVKNLLSSQKAKEFKYFPKGNIKKGYVLFENPENRKPVYWKKYFIKAIEKVQ